MGKHNSTKTRVQPLFDFIASDPEKMGMLFSLFSKNNTEKFTEISECYYGDSEKSIAPSRGLLRWCIDNLDKLSMPNDYGVKITSTTYEKRKKLFSKDAKIISEAKQLLNRNVLLQRGWYIFEGYTHPDIYFESDDTIYIGEAKRTEDKLTPSTLWLKERDQLIRHIDAVMDSGRRVRSFLIVEKPDLYNINQYDSYDFFKKNMPHRDEEVVKKAYESFIGYCTWDAIQKKLGVEYLNTVDDI